MTLEKGTLPKQGELFDAKGKPTPEALKKTKRVQGLPQNATAKKIQQGAQTAIAQKLEYQNSIPFNNDKILRRTAILSDGVEYSFRFEKDCLFFNENGGIAGITFKIKKSGDSKSYYQFCINFLAASVQSYKNYSSTDASDEYALFRNQIGSIQKLDSRKGTRFFGSGEYSDDARPITTFNYFSYLFRSKNDFSSGKNLHQSIMNQIKDVIIGIKNEN